MQQTKLGVLIVLALALAGCARLPPDVDETAVVSAADDLIREEEAALRRLPEARRSHYKCDPYINAATRLQGLGKETALKVLTRFASYQVYGDMRLFVLCRMFFAARPGSEFRRPMLGYPSLPGWTDIADWPLEPI